VITKTDVVAMPPMRALSTPSIISVLRSVSVSASPSRRNGYTDVSAATERLRKIALTIVRTKMNTSRVRRYPTGPSVRRATSPMVRPPSRRLVNITVMSWTAPKKIPPATTHNHTGCQPNAIASVGPTIGPAPAMVAKWWAKATSDRALTKSSPSAWTSDGGALYDSTSP